MMVGVGFYFWPLFFFLMIHKMTIVYALFYDDENGQDRESWSIFYTPLEIFTTKADRDKRIADIKEYDSTQAFDTRDITLGKISELNWKWDDD